jgi:hypothetical protein
MMVRAALLLAYLVPLAALRGGSAFSARHHTHHTHTITSTHPTHASGTFDRASGWSESRGHMGHLGMVYMGLAPRGTSMRTSTRMHMSNSRWEGAGAEGIDENVEKAESAKIALVSLLGGGVISLPLGGVLGVLQGFDASWQIQHVALTLSLLLFGITYRYLHVIYCIKPTIYI